ncbi:hypothetical protein D3C76_1480450 [compost metagenome]
MNQHKIQQQQRRASDETKLLGDHHENRVRIGERHALRLNRLPFHVPFPGHTAGSDRQLGVPGVIGGVFGRFLRHQPRIDPVNPVLAADLHKEVVHLIVIGLVRRDASDD